MVYSIRQASPSDARAIACGHVDAWRWTYAKAIPTSALDMLSVDERAEAWRSMLLTKPRTVGVWVAEVTSDSLGRPSEIVGFAQAGPSRDSGGAPINSAVQGDLQADLLPRRTATLPSSRANEDSEVGELFAIYLLSKVVGRGIGKALMTKAEQFLHDGPYAEATLWVLDTNERARRFYEALGWRPDGATQDAPGIGYTLHELRYRKVLQPI